MSSTDRQANGDRVTAPRTRRLRRTVAALCLALTATVALGAPAVSAQAGSSTEAPAPDPATQAQRRARLEKACARVPVITERVDALIARLEGDAGTKGSLAWLQARIDSATAAGRAQLVTVLQNRLEVRTARLELLHERRDALAHVAQICDERLAG
jgi:hypothetical protein